jgi:hypothetical protein
MLNFKRPLAVIITGIILSGFIVSNSSNNTVVKANANTSEEIKGNKSTIDLSKLEFSYPKGWTKRVYENEIFFDEENKQTVGGITLVGYYGDYQTTLPNHSEILTTEDVDTGLGKGKLFTLERDYPAAAGNNEIWIEIHAIIPVSKNNLAYDIWVKGEKDTLLEIFKSIR